MKKRKILMGLLCSTFVLTSLVGCSNSEGEPKTTTTGKESKIVYENDYVKLIDYKGIEYSDSIAEVTEKDVEDRINEYLQANAQYEKIEEGTAEKGKTVNVSFIGKINNEEFANGSAENVDVSLGSNTFIEGFEDGIVGMSVGETKDVAVTFPEDYGEEALNGKEAVFTITLNYLCGEKNVVPELNDEYVKTVSEAKTVDEYKEQIKQELIESNKTSFDENLRKELVSYLVDNSEFKKIPKDMIEDYKEKTIQYYKDYAEMFSMEYKDFVTQMLNTTEKDLDKTLNEEAEESVKATLVFKAIAENEKIKVTDTDYNEYLAEKATNYGYESVDALKAEIKKNKQQEDSKLECLNNLVYDVIYDNAVYVASEEEIESMESEVESTEKTITEETSK